MSLKLQIIQLLTLFLFDVISSYRLVRTRTAEDTNEVTNGNFFFKTPPPEQVSLPLGGTLQLLCEAGGPSPTIHWLYNGQRIAQDDEGSSEDEDFYVSTSSRRQQLNIGATKSKLIVECMTTEMAGEYTCVADTPTDRIAATTQVNVEFKGDEIGASCLTKRQGVAQPAQVYMWTAQRLEMAGTDVQMFCRATGYPRPQITWYDRHGNAINSSNGQYEILPNGDLIVRDIQFTNMGIYRCEASNQFGNDVQQAFLYPTKP